MNSIANQANETKKSPVTLTLFILISLTPLFALTVPFSWDLVSVAIFTYSLRMFGITAAYHRYFSHNAFKTSRVFQFLLGWLGAMAMQKGPLWWAAHHRNHHKFSDTDKDLHSPNHGFWHSHMLWFLRDDHNEFDAKIIKDYTKYPELIWLDKYHWVPPLMFSIVLGFISWPVLVYGYGVANFVAGHATWTINSLAHVYGSQRYKTGDLSRNNFWLALITFGEGWHNNHHHYRHSANMGFYWWEVDITYYVLKVFSWFGLVWDLKKVPDHVLDEGLKNDAQIKGKKEYKSIDGTIKKIDSEETVPAFI